MPYQTLPIKVVILGGGIGGLSAAQELVERGFAVEVYERSRIPGGKARSMNAKGTGKNGMPDLPAEHGFRFFPGFYSHVTDSMRRIPFGNNPQGVFDNLVDAEFAQNVKDSGPSVIVNTAGTKNPILSIARMMGSFRFFSSGLNHSDAEFFIRKIWQIWTSSKARVHGEYEKIAWWDFLEADSKSEAYQHYLAKGTTTQLVASKPKLASTKTVGETGIRLIIDSIRYGLSDDRVLNGPTNEVWIEPWVKHIRGLGAKYVMDQELKRINMASGKIISVEVLDLQSNQSKTISADVFVFALPIEVMAKFLTEELTDAAPELLGLFPLSKMTEWMNGIMFYLREVPNMPKGHASFVDSPWALTSVAQAKLWEGYDLTGFGDGQVKDILSVVISDWKTPGLLVKKPAMECTPDEIALETWHQVKTAMNAGRHEVFTNDMLHSWFLDPDIVNIADNPHNKVNLEPLLVNMVNSWRFRPNAYTSIPNMFLAADYVRTNTDIATMESANEAARRAVNKILEITGSDAPQCLLWTWERPWYIKPLCWSDAWRYSRGLPWSNASWAAGVLFKLALVLDKLTNRKLTL